MVSVFPYGSWLSPVTPELLVEESVRLGQVVVDGDDVYWNEGRASDAGRQVIVRLRRGDETRQDVLPEGFSARTLVHEYGGQSYAVHDGAVYFSNFADQRLWRVEAGGSDAPEPLTPEPHSPRSVRYADP